jgi:hypothetical protein
MIVSMWFVLLASARAACPWYLPEPASLRCAKAPTPRPVPDICSMYFSINASQLPEPCEHEFCQL